MPELPEVEAIRRRLARRLRGATVARVRILRSEAVRPQNPRALARRVRGQKIERVERRGKNLLLRLSGGEVVRIHLRMTGHLDIVPAGTPLRAAVRVAFELADGRTLVLDDARALGKVHVHTAEEILSVLAAVGIEPLSRDFTAEWLIEAARKSRRPVKLFLMDQASVAGLGNIYAAEALFRAGIHPSRIASEISSLRLRRLHRAIVDVLWDAVQSAGAVYRFSGGFSATETFQPAVYGREGESCGRCGARVRRLVQAGRSTYYCPRCQR